MPLKPTFYGGVPYFGPDGKPAFGQACCPFDPTCYIIHLSTSAAISGQPPSDLYPPLPADGNGSHIYKEEGYDEDTPGVNGNSYYTIVWGVSGCFEDSTEQLAYEQDLSDWITTDNPWVLNEGDWDEEECDQDSIEDAADTLLSKPAGVTNWTRNVLDEYSAPALCCPEVS